MAIRIGASPIAWSNDDLRELGAETSLESCLADGRRIGLEGFELGHKFPREASALKAALAPFGLACISGWYSCELLTRDVEAELEAAKAHLDLLQAMGASVVVFAETSNAIHSDRSKPLSTRPVLPARDWAEFGRRLTRVAEATAQRGLRLVYHHHMGTIVQSEADIDALMAATGEAVSLVLDTGHAFWGGADPVALARRYRSRIHHVHTKDVRPAVMAAATAKDLSFLDAVLDGVYTVPGDGCIDYAAVFRELPGYDGWVVIEAEQDPAKADPYTYAAKGHAHLVAVLAETGLVPARA